MNKNKTKIVIANALGEITLIENFTTSYSGNAVELDRKEVYKHMRKQARREWKFIKNAINKQGI